MLTIHRLVTGKPNSLARLLLKTAVGQEEVRFFVVTPGLSIGGMD